ncbi:hypothetical protein [Pedobacter helvus]|uniref:DUF4397 domain-containing protein n=1 Tax=Pedobacter helvus TaxID=2563444 RepID=A0ABW9JN59_9SPHI|nr:hypothetical protein [Pedobacter ureilyticus]
MKHYIKSIALIILVAGLFTACKKEELNAEKAMQIVVNGYNGSSNALQLSIDTTVYDVNTNYGSYIMRADAVISQNVVYTYRSEKKRMLTLTDTVTKQIVFSRELPADSPKGLFNYIFLNGKELEINAPAADPTTNKLGFYVHYPTSNEPFDIFLYRVDNTTGTEYRTYIAQNVKPGTWTYVNYDVPANFNNSRIIGNSGATVCFTKAGSTNLWAFDNDQSKSSILASSLLLPVENEKGLVQPYFYTPSLVSQGLSRLFFYPERQ